MAEKEERKLLAAFCAWLSARHGGEALDQEALDAWIDDFQRERAQSAARNRRRDFLCRLMVCGFAHVIAVPGRAPDDGQLPRGFVPLFVRAFNEVVAERIGNDVHAKCRLLLRRDDIRDLPDRAVWPTLAGAPETARVFLDVVVGVAVATAEVPDPVGRLERAMDELAPECGSGLHDRKDVEIVFAAWFGFLAALVRDGVGGVPFARLYGEDAAAAVVAFYERSVPEATRSLYESDNEIYLSQVAPSFRLGKQER